MIEEIKQLYSEYLKATETPPKRTFADLFRGWFTGRGRDMTDTDRAFADELSLYVDRIVNECPKEAYGAACVILGVPVTNKFTGRDLMFPAMHSKVAELLPCMSKSEAEELLAVMGKVPRLYRFPVYKQLTEQINQIIK